MDIATEFSGPEVIWDDESILQLVFGKNGRRIVYAKDEKDRPDSSQCIVQKQPLWWYGCASVCNLGHASQFSQIVYAGFCSNCNGNQTNVISTVNIVDDS